MLKKDSLFLFLAIVIAACIYTACAHLFRPVIFAKKISGFDIPMNARVLVFKEQWSDFNGNGYALSKLVVNDAALGRIVKQCLVGNYRILPVDQSSLGFSDENTDKLISKKDVGFYKTFLLKDEFSIIVVNTKQYTVTTYTSIF